MRSNDAVNIRESSGGGAGGRPAGKSSGILVGGDSLPAAESIADRSLKKLASIAKVAAAFKLGPAGLPTGRRPQ